MRGQGVGVPEIQSASPCRARHRAPDLHFGISRAICTCDRQTPFGNRTAKTWKDVMQLSALPIRVYDGAVDPVTRDASGRTL